MLKKAGKKQREKFPEKAKARKLANRILSKKPCSVEGCENQDIHKHHPDYSKPLDVVYLCQDHHVKLHRTGRIS